MGICTTVSSRCVLNACLFAILWHASLPPFDMPTYFIAFAPLAWRNGIARLTVWPTLFIVGLSSIAVFPFLFSLTKFFNSHEMRIGITLVGSIMFGCQIGVIAILLQCLQSVAVLLRAAVGATVAVMLELLQMRIGCPWPALTISVVYAESDLAQCSQLLGWGGCCWIIYFSQFLISLDYNYSGFRKYSGIIAFLVVLSLTNIAGARLRASHEHSSFPIDIGIIQTNRTFNDVTESRRLASMDLVVFPENSFFHDEVNFVDAEKWSSPVLLCGPYFEKELYNKNGLPFVASKATVRAQLYFGGELNFTHSKAALVPFVERFPPWVEWLGLTKLAQHFFDPQSFIPGDGRYRPFILETRSGRRLEIGVSVCYEMYLPYLPQYRTLPKPQLIVHQCNNSWIDWPIVVRRHAVARAIETRSWQVVVANSHGSCIVSPSGRVVKSLGRGESVSIFVRGDFNCDD